MKRSKKKRVVIAFPQHHAYVERIIQGILDYANECGKWSLTRMPELQNVSMDWLKQWPGDGAFVIIASEGDGDLARTLPFPVVNLSALVKNHDIPTVMVDHYAVGRMGAEHLLSRHFKQFGYYGSLSKPFSELRRNGFRDTVIRAGYPCRIYEAPGTPDSIARWTDMQKGLERWVHSLPRPIGIMACNDPRAGMILDICLASGISVPGEIAIIGADNDPVACTGGAVALSSVARKDKTVGYEAALLLDRIMAGEPAPDKPILVAPEGIIQRRSTESFALQDPLLAAAVQYVQEHINESFGVERLVEIAGISRRRFELRFQEAMSKTPYEFILEQRVERARQMLEERTPHTLTEVAAASGFTELRHLRAAFQRVIRISPAEYRRKAQGA